MADYVCDAPRKDGIYTFLKTMVIFKKLINL